MYYSRAHADALREVLADEVLSVIYYIIRVIKWFQLFQVAVTHLVTDFRVYRAGHLRSSQKVNLMMALEEKSGDSPKSVGFIL